MAETLAFQDYQQEIKEVKKLKDGSIQLPFSKEIAWGKVEFNFRLKKNQEGKIIIENNTEITAQNKGYVFNKDKKYVLDTSSSSSFAKSLWAALDAYIGNVRPSLSQEKWKQAYSLIGFKEVLKKEQEEQKALEETKRELEILKDSRFKRDSEEKTLNFEYNIWYGGEEKIIYAKIKQIDWNKIKFTMISGYLRSLAKKNTIEKIFTQEEMKTALPEFVHTSFKNGIEYPKIIGKRKHIAPEQTRKNAVNKAIRAIEVFEFYNK